MSRWLFHGLNRVEWTRQKYVLCTMYNVDAGCWSKLATWKSIHAESVDASSGSGILEISPRLHGEYTDPGACSVCRRHVQLRRSVAIFHHIPCFTIFTSIDVFASIHPASLLSHLPRYDSVFSAQ